MHKDRSKENAAKLSVCSNSMLVAVKLGIGLFTGSISVISEALHSGVDLFAAGIAFCAVRMADKGPDSRHTYGHGKIENFSGAIEAILIIVAALWIVWEAIPKILHPTVPENIEYGIVIMLISAIVNYYVSRHLFRVAKQTESHALEADALHLQADIYTSMGVFIGLLLVRFTGLYWLDPFIAIGVALIILKAGCDMTRKSVEELLDVSLADEEIKCIEEILRRHPGVIDYNRLRSRRSGSNRLIDVYLYLEKTLSLEGAHAICDQVEKQIHACFIACDIVIHTEPAEQQKSICTSNVSIRNEG